MASHASKAKRRAVALDDLQRLSSLIAEHLEIDPPSMLPGNPVDPELAQIQQVESINELLKAVLDKSGVQVNSEMLAGMTEAELLQKAASEGVEVNKSAKKAEIIEALESAE